VNIPGDVNLLSEFSLVLTKKQLWSLSYRYIHNNHQICTLTNNFSSESPLINNERKKIREQICFNNGAGEETARIQRTAKTPSARGWRNNAKSIAPFMRA